MVKPMRCLLVLLAFLCVSWPAYAADYEEGRAAYLAGDYERALDVWHSLAAEGDARAQFSLGQMYHEGIGVEQNDVISTRWFRKAAEQGYAPAQFNLGNAYKHGRGVRPDDLAAAVWWRRAAEQGVAEAQFNLATLFYFGRGVPQDKTEALEWYRRAADNGHPEARRTLKVLAGTPEDIAAAQSPSAESGGATAPTTARGALQGEDWILGQNPADYTIQVIATRQERSLLDALERYQLREPVAYFRFLRHGEPWYAAIYGAFPTRSQAQRSAQALPKGLRDNEPWIRQLGAVQALIRRE